MSVGLREETNRQALEESPLEWLARFEREHGRQLRVIHVGNIANNAYNNAKIQRRRGIEADVVCWDYFHIMGSPEWEDADFEGDVGDPFFPDWWAVDLHGFSRPRWFAQGRFAACQRYLLAFGRRRRLRAALLWKRLQIERWLLSRGRSKSAVGIGLVAQASRRVLRMIPRSRRRWRLRLRRRRMLLSWVAEAAARRDYRTAASHALAMVHRARPTEIAALSGEPPSLDGPDERLVVRFRELFPDRTPLSRLDCEPYLMDIARWRRLFDEYDVVQAYATAPIIPLLCGVPFTAYEHGTLRETPFEESPIGRTSALGFREAATVFVTNSDVLPAAKRLGLAGTQIICMPHAVDSDRLLKFGRDHAHLRPLAEGPVRFLSPTRQDWRDAHPSWTKGNDRAIRALGLLRDRGLDCRLLLGEWGRDLDASKQLVAELGVEHMIEWVPALRKTALWKAYLEAHAVLDQFVLPAIGGVAFEAMALGRRVITALDVPTAERFFGEGPPLMACSEPEEIADAMAEVIRDPDDRAGLGERARDWFARRHSADRIVELQVDAYRRLLVATP